MYSEGRAVGRDVGRGVGGCSKITKWDTKLNCCVYCYDLTWSDIHPLTFANWELCTWLGVAVSELIVSD